MFMSVASGLLILTGLEIMAFGLFMLYAWLALLYAPIGFDAGILLGRHSPGMLVQQRLLSALLARLFLAPGHMHSSPAGACCLVFPAVSYLAFPWPPLSDSMAGLMASLAECSHWSAARVGNAATSQGGLKRSPRIATFEILRTSYYPSGNLRDSPTNNGIGSKMKHDNLSVRWRTLFFAAGLALSVTLPITTAVAQSSANCRAYAEDYAERYSAGSAWGEAFRIGGRRSAANAMVADRRRRLQRATVIDNAYTRCMRDRWP
jgi:hypothetical protein